MLLLHGLLCGVQRPEGVLGKGHGLLHYLLALLLCVLCQQQLLLHGLQQVGLSRHVAIDSCCHGCCCCCCM